MLCEKCNKNNASVFYEENINGKKRSFALCEECAAELKKSGELSFGDGFFSFPHSASLHDNLFGTLFGLPHAGTSEKVCPSCGSTIYDLKKTGKVGCGECYKTFSSELGRTIHQIHGNSKHIGKAPKAFSEKHKKENELSSLKTKLREAIEKEAFEEAAKLRDRIRQVEGEV